MPVGSTVFLDSFILTAGLPLPVWDFKQRLGEQGKLKMSNFLSRPFLQVGKNLVKGDGGGSGSGVRGGGWGGR